MNSKTTAMLCKKGSTMHCNHNLDSLYHKFYLDQKNAAFFFNPNYLKAVGGSSIKYRKYEKDGQLVAVCVFKLSGRKITTPILTQSLGFLFDENRKLSVSQKRNIVVQMIKPLRALDFDLAIDASYNDPVAFNHIGVTTHTGVNLYKPYEVMQSDEIINGFTKQQRYDCRRTTRKYKLSFKRDSDPHSLFDLIKMSYNRHGRRPPYNFEILSKILTVDDSALTARVYTVQLGENTLAAGLFVIDARRVTYLAGGFDQNYATYTPMSLLIYNAIRISKHLKKDFSFEGSNVLTINDFFQKFNPNTELYMRLKRKTFKNALLDRVQRAFG